MSATTKLFVCCAVIWVIVTMVVLPIQPRCRIHEKLSNNVVWHRAIAQKDFRTVGPHYYEQSREAALAWCAETLAEGGAEQ